MKFDLNQTYDQCFSLKTSRLPFCSKSFAMYFLKGIHLHVLRNEIFAT